MKPILTTQKYWDSIPNSVKSVWQKKADAIHDAIVCTDRPNARLYKGDQVVRRCSTGGKWGKCTDRVHLNVDALLREGYVWRIYEKGKA